MLIRIRYRDSGYAARIATTTVTTAQPPESTRLFISGMNEISGVSTAWKLSSVNSLGTSADSVADGSKAASRSHTSGTAKHSATSTSTPFATARITRPLGEVMREPGGRAARLARAGRVAGGVIVVTAMVSPPPGAVP